MHRRLPAVLVAALGITLAVGVAAPTAAQAASYPLERPSGEHLVADTPSSFTIGVNRAPHASGYRVYTSTSREGVYAANVSSATHQGYSTSTHITVGGLPYTTATYWYRVKTIHGGSYRWGDIFAAGVQPPTPTGLRVTSGQLGLHLNWTAGSASTYVVAWATNTAMTTNRVTRILWSHGTQYSPEGLQKGVHYYFQIAARNHGAISRYGAQTSGTPVSGQQSVLAVSYNVLMLRMGGLTSEAGTPYSTWTQRRPGVVTLLESSRADVIGIQEAGDWYGYPEGYGGQRQVDNLVANLPGYALARTETPPTESGYVRNYSYVLYKSASWTPAGGAGVWDLGDGRKAAHVILRNNSSGAQFLFVSAHLTAGHSDALDAERGRETTSLISQANSAASYYGVPLVYSGDFNSSVDTYTTDAPGNAMRAAGVGDTRLSAVERYNEAYNSANQYLRTPPQNSHSIDYVYAGPGVTTWSWGVMATLVHGQFVGYIPSDHDPVWAHMTVPY